MGFTMQVCTISETQAALIIRNLLCAFKFCWQLGAVTGGQNLTSGACPE
jgi:hypothetical protein